MSKQGSTASAAVDYAEGQARARRTMRTSGVLACLCVPAVTVLAMLLAAAITSGWARYAVTAGVTFALVVPIAYLLVRISLSRQRETGRLIDTLTGRLSAAAETTARQYRRLSDAQRVAGLGSFEQHVATGRIHASDQLCRMLGRPAGSVIDADILMQSVHPDDRGVLGAAIGRCVSDHTPADVEHRLIAADGTMLWVHAQANWAGADDSGQPLIVGTVLDITDRKQAQDALEYQSMHDSLTGLANRALFLDRVEHTLRRSERLGAPVAVLFLDLDDFKTVNDSLGRPTGDRLLVAVARRIASVARAGDTVARFGGDEFALLLESGEMPDAAGDVAKRITDALARPFHLGGKELTVRASIGIAVSEGPAEGSDLLRDADLAMYMAKRGGKGTFEMARPGMRDEAVNRLAVITDLRHALGHAELEVFYQPIVTVGDKMPVGVEALVRWHHPSSGLVAPDGFVGIAESSGLIVPLGDWVLNEACRQAQAWRGAGVIDGDFYVSVNLSARQLAEPLLVHDVARALHDSGLRAEALVLEITESTLMVDFAAALARLRSLEDLGVRLALDDYGTGYSSLARLGSLPVDFVKIDKSFIDQIVGNPQGTALVKSVVDLASAIGITSIAEGVEREDQYAALAAIGCGCIQGYLFAKPMPAEDTARTLERLSVQPLASPPP